MNFCINCGFLLQCDIFKLASLTYLLKTLSISAHKRTQMTQKSVPDGNVVSPMPPQLVIQLEFGTARVASVVTARRTCLASTVRAHGGCQKASHSFVRRPLDLKLSLEDLITVEVEVHGGRGWHFSLATAQAHVLTGALIFLIL